MAVKSANHRSAFVQACVPVFNGSEFWVFTSAYIRALPIADAIG
jgi:hypothetical protein